MQLNTQQQVDAAESTLRLSWVIVAGAVIFSVLTVTPLVQRVTPDRWHWTAPILPIVVDTAVVIVVRVDAIVARLGERPGGWPALLRWLTGLMTLALNVGDSALKGDLVGVGVHAVAPTLLIVTAEAALKWRQKIANAAARIDREHREREEDRRREQREQQERSRADREREQEARRLERERQEAADRERRREEAAEREQECEHAARLAREERDHQARLEREREERADRLRREQQEAQQRAERERPVERQQEALTRMATSQQQPVREHPDTAVPAPVSTPTPEPVSTPAPAVSTTSKLSEADALTAVRDGVATGVSTRELARLTGWSLGWVTARAQEARAELAAA